MKHILLLLFAGLIYFQGQAQTPKSFSEENFITEFTAYIQKSKRTESITSATAFVDTYNGLSSDLQADVRKTANGMLTNKVRNFPVYMEYADIVTEIVAKSGEGVTTKHITILRELMDASKPSAYKQFENYIEYLPELFESNTLYQTKTKGWYFLENAKYDLAVEEGKPVLIFSEVDIIGRSKSDSITISKTSGKCFPNQKQWIGSKGMMNFTRAGIAESDAHIELTDYSLDLGQSEYNIDSVYLVYPNYVDGKILGDFSEKLYSTVTQNISYPKFESRALDLSIKNIHERVSTSGGFTLIGDKLVIKGSPEKYATLYLSTNGKKQVSAVAQQFVVNNKKQEIIAENAEVSIQLSQDSIYHPSLLFRFKMDENRLSLEKGDGITENVPYESPYHQMTIGLNALSFHLDSTNINFTTIDRYTGNPVSFTSYDHFIPGGDLKYLTLTGRNPLQMIKTMADSYGSDELTGYDLSGSLGYPLKEIESVIYKLAKDGFVFYDPVTKRMKVNYKTHLYIEAGKDEIDYDNMQFISNPKASNLNGVLSLDSQTIHLFGIEDFDLSRPKQVAVFPKNNEMILSKDRDLDLEGTLQAGKLLFKGQGIHFDYEGFKADMQSVDSLIIYVKGPEDINGEVRYVPLKSVLSDIKGALFIDEPGNRSGLNDYKEFPYFESYDTAFVYFDHYDSVAYKQENFYFSVLPFKLDSIVTTVTDSIEFYGELVSADIFNPFETYLSVQPDYTLGINELAPAEGLELYKGAGTFYGSYHLTSIGLYGEGKVKYGQSEFGGPEIKFYADSSYAITDTFNMIESATADIPQASAGKTEIYWSPYEDKLVIDADGEPYQFYSNELEYVGGLLYQNGVLNGISDSGSVSTYKFKGAEISADEGVFKKDFVTTNDGTISVAKENGENFLSGYFGTAKIDFTQGTAIFENPSDSFLVEFPGMVSNMQKYTWNFNEGTITFENDENNSQYFLSTDETMDSLQIFAGKAIYNIENGTLEAREIDEISLADSKLIPAGRKLTVLEGGKFDAIENGTLILNSAEEFFTINNANLVVNSRNDFRGTGNFKYEGETGTYDIAIDDIKVHIDTVSEKKKELKLAYSVDARGVVTEEDKFRLNQEMYYKGNLLMSSTSKDIKFEGFGKLDFKQKETASWFNLDQGIDPENFSLKLDSLKDEFKQDVTAGMFVSPGELELYSVIMEPARTKRDPALHAVNGSLFKGENAGEFIFGIEDSTNSVDLSKSFMKYNDNTGEVAVDGFIQWTSGIKLIDVNGFGTLDYNPATKKAKGKSTIAINFPMDPVIWYEWPRDIVEYNYEAKEIEYNKPEIKRALSNYITKAADADLVIGDIEGSGLFQLPVGFQPKLFLTDVELEWDEVDGNFKSVNTIGLSSIAGFPIDQQIKAYLEFGHSLGTGYMNLYFETKEGTWYFITAKNGALYAISSDSDFNDMVEGSKEKSITEGKKGEVIFEFLGGNLTSKVTFLSRVEDFLVRTTGKGFTAAPAPKPKAPVIPIDTSTIKETPLEKGELEQMLEEGNPENKKAEGMPWNAPTPKKKDEPKKEESKSLVDPEIEKAEEVIDAVEEKVEKTEEKAEEVIKESSKKGKGKDKVEEVIEENKEKVEDKTKEVIDDKKEEAEEKVEEVKEKKGKKSKKEEE